MKKAIRYAVRVFAGLFIALLCYAIYSVYWQVAPTGVGYKAKLLCSAVFVAGGPEKTVLAEELSPKVNKLLYLVSAGVDYNDKSATATAFGLRSARGVSRRTCSRTSSWSGGKISSWISTTVPSPSP